MSLYRVFRPRVVVEHPFGKGSLDKHVSGLISPDLGRHCSRITANAVPDLSDRLYSSADYGPISRDPYGSPSQHREPAKPLYRGPYPVYPWDQMYPDPVGFPAYQGMAVPALEPRLDRDPKPVTYEESVMIHEMLADIDRQPDQVHDVPVVALPEQGTLETRLAEHENVLADAIDDQLQEAPSMMTVEDFDRQAGQLWGHCPAADEQPDPLGYEDTPSLFDLFDQQMDMLISQPMMPPPEMMCPENYGPGM